MPLETLNPANEESVKVFDEMTDKAVDEIISSCHKEFIEWRKLSYSHRKPYMLKAARILNEETERYAKILTLEMGKTITQARAEVKKCAWVCEYYAENTESILKEELIETDAAESFVQFDPLGIVLAVMPWNFPFWQVFRFAAPALMAGNGALLKHASNVPQSALAIEEIFHKAGFPENIFRTLMIGSSKVSRVIENPLVKATTLTGSEFAGKKVAETCGANLKKSVMELGGSDPFIVLENADIELASSTAVTARLLNNGQSCIAAKRFIVVESIYDEFETLFLKKMRSIKIGDPMDEETDLGPMAREDLMLELHEQVRRSVEMGATVILGGKPLEGKGYYYPPTIITNLIPGMPAYEDELFGPVASLIKVKNEDEAIRVANDSVFGLGASLWTSDINKAKLLATKIQAGSVFINGLVKSDPRLPFGGINISGYGRELSHYGIKEFVNIKTVWIK